MGVFENKGNYVKLWPHMGRFLGSQNAAILYQRILDLVDFYGREGILRMDGFVYQPMEKFTVETGLSRFEQDRARKILIDKGWLEVKKIRANGHATLHYKPIEEIVHKPVDKRNGNVRKSQTSTWHNDKLDVRKSQSIKDRYSKDNKKDRENLINKLSI